MLAKLESDFHQIKRVKMSRDGKRIAAAGNAGVRIWDWPLKAK